MPVREKTAEEMLGGKSAIVFGSSSEAALIKKYLERSARRKAESKAASKE